jgi:hypothetical protein
MRNDAVQRRFKVKIATSRFLRWVFVADAATCLATGLLMIIGSAFFAEFLGLPAGLLRYAGASLLPFASLLVYLISRESLSPASVWTVIVLNALWTVDSFLVVATGWITPTQLGYAFVTTQALGVAMFAGLEYVGLRKSAAAIF